MNFLTSTHRARWIFKSTEALQERYESVHATAVARLSTAAADADVNAANAAETAPISAADERVLRLYYEGRLRALAEAAGLPPRVAITALCYFKRFYAGAAAAEAAAAAAEAAGQTAAAAAAAAAAEPTTSSLCGSTGASCLEHDPARIAPACLYLACKVEEAPVLADELAARLQGGAAAQAAVDAIRAGGKAPVSDMGTALLRTEVPLLQGLGFELIVHSPRRALLGLLQDLAWLGSDAGSGGGGSGSSSAGGGTAAAPATPPEGTAPATRTAALAHCVDPELAAAPLAALVLGERHQDPQLLLQQRAEAGGPHLRGALAGRALRALDAALASDAPLLHAPGALAAAALRSALRRQNLPWRGWAARVAAMSVAEAAAAPGGGGGGGGGGGAGEEAGAEAAAAKAKAAAERLAAEMDGVDALVVAWQKEQAGGGGEAAAAQQQQQQQQQEQEQEQPPTQAAEAPAAAAAQAPTAAPALAERAADADRRLKVWRAAQRQKVQQQGQPSSGKRARSDGGGADDGGGGDDEEEG
jgi:hypothetical protein